LEFFKSLFIIHFTNTKTMKPSVQEQVSQLLKLVSIVVKMIREDYPDTTSVCSKNSMNLGEFKRRVKLSKKDVEVIKTNQPVSNELIKLDLCERAIKQEVN